MTTLMKFLGTSLKEVIMRVDTESCKDTCIKKKFIHTNTAEKNFLTSKTIEPVKCMPRPLTLSILKCSVKFYE